MSRSRLPAVVCLVIGLIGGAIFGSIVVQMELKDYEKVVFCDRVQTSLQPDCRKAFHDAYEAGLRGGRSSR